MGCHALEELILYRAHQASAFGCGGVKPQEACLKEKFGDRLLVTPGIACGLAGRRHKRCHSQAGDRPADYLQSGNL